MCVVGSNALLFFLNSSCTILDICMETILKLDSLLTGQLASLHKPVLGNASVA